ncbi:protein max isoform X2 [Chrysoperla carnea]|uniref:protein max isoform X2 n=1 Tax=Chrysoperla carnea TaxID=189513 RepID=UPI001D08E293|nr:protein max isoform X2 [Chrysoperla carnea]
MIMSDDDRDIDIESDEEDSDSRSQPRQNSGSQYFSQAEKRAHHNALERKRRDHIKDSFSSLRDAVPSLQGEKASRAQILKKAAEYIQFMRRKNNSHQQDIDDLKRQNNLLESQIRTLEKARATGNFAVEASESGKVGLDDGVYHPGETESDTSDTEGTVMPPMPRRGPKKLKVASVYH